MSTTRPVTVAVVTCPAKDDRGRRIKTRRETNECTMNHELLVYLRAPAGCVSQPCEFAPGWFAFAVALAVQLSTISRHATAGTRAELAESREPQCPPYD